MTTAVNPYSAPASDVSAETITRTALRELVLSWEKFRLFYNGVLLLPGIGVLAIGVAGGVPSAAAVVIALMGGLAANTAFFLGPLAELYLRALFLKGDPAPMLRRLLLAGGFLVSFTAMGIFAVGFTTF